MKSMHHSKHYPGTVFAVIMALEKIIPTLFDALYRAEKIAFGAEWC